MSIDQGVVARFAEFKGTASGKHWTEIDITSIKFQEIDIFNHLSVTLVGPRSLGSHTDLARMNKVGGIPVYDASAAPKYWVEEEKDDTRIFSSEASNPDLSFANEGNSSAGTNFVTHVGKYYINNHRNVIKLALDSPFYGPYLLFRLSNMKEEFGFKRGATPSKDKLKQLGIKARIPVPTDRHPGRELQRMLVEFSNWHKSKLGSIAGKAGKIEKNASEMIAASTNHMTGAVELLIPSFQEWSKGRGQDAEIDLSEIKFVEMEIFNNPSVKLIGAKELAKHAELARLNDEAGVPVYDASPGPKYFVREEKYSEKLFISEEANPDISFANEGDSSAGRNFVVHKGKYFVNNHRTVIKLGPESPFYGPYLLFRLAGMKEEFGFKRGYTPSSEKMRDLKINARVPVGADGLPRRDVQIVLVEFMRDFHEKYHQLVEKAVALQKLCVELDRSFTWNLINNGE